MDFEIVGDYRLIYTQLYPSLNGNIYNCYPMPDLPCHFISKEDNSCLEFHRSTDQNEICPRSVVSKWRLLSHMWFWSLKLLTTAPGGIIARTSSISDLDNEILGFQIDNILGFKLMLNALSLSEILDLVHAFCRWYRCESFRVGGQTIGRIMILLKMST